MPSFVRLAEPNGRSRHSVVVPVGCRGLVLTRLLDHQRRNLHGRLLGADFHRSSLHVECPEPAAPPFAVTPLPFVDTADAWRS